MADRIAVAVAPTERDLRVRAAQFQVEPRVTVVAPLHASPEHGNTTADLERSAEIGMIGAVLEEERNVAVHTQSRAGDPDAYSLKGIIVELALGTQHRDGAVVYLDARGRPQVLAFDLQFGAALGHCGGGSPGGGDQEGRDASAGRQPAYHSGSIRWEG